MPPAKQATKRVAATLKLQLDAGQANPGKVGQALGAHGVNIIEFCRQYNAATEQRRGWVVPVVVTIYADHSFTFVTRTPPVSKLLLAAAGGDRGSAVPNRDSAGTVSSDHVREIALTKLPDLNTDDVEAAMRVVAGTARSMGITIKD